MLGETKTTTTLDETDRETEDVQEIAMSDGEAGIEIPVPDEMTQKTRIVG